jgi:hypothetical protein
MDNELHAVGGCQSNLSVGLRGLEPLTSALSGRGLFDGSVSLLSGLSRYPQFGADAFPGEASASGRSDGLCDLTLTSGSREGGPPE